VLENLVIFSFFFHSQRNLNEECRAERHIARKNLLDIILQVEESITSKKKLYADFLTLKNKVATENFLLQDEFH
jgi:hypothetical protein